MKRMLFLMLMPFLLIGCSNAQSTNKGEKAGKNMQAGESANKPKVEIKVNKVYDDNGNLVGYDSTYVWSYSNVEGDSVFVNPDTLMFEFRPYFYEHFPDFKLPESEDIFFNDSAFYQDFFMPDYFYERWQQSLRESDRVFREMDSLKNIFFKEHYPGLQKPEK